MAAAEQTTDYVVRSSTRADKRRTRYTVVDMAGQVHHVTITDQALYDGHGDTVIRAAIARFQRLRPPKP